MSAELPTWTAGDTTPEQERFMEQMIGRSTMMAAYKQLTGNKGAPGIDGMTVEDLKSALGDHQRQTGEGHLPAPSGTRRGDTHGSRPAHPAGTVSGARPDV